MSDVTTLHLPDPGAALTTPRAQVPGTVGLVVHPSRTVDEPLRLVREWAQRHGVELLQAPANYDQRHVAEPGDPHQADLIISIGGDGTTLAALRTGAVVSRPVMGIACGSLGALATVSVGEVARSLDRFCQGEWQPRRFPALWVARSQEERRDLFALNDVSVVRSSGGQVRIAVSADGELYARIAGDGAVVSTAIGSSGYAISAGGPLLANGLEGFVFTPLPKHGGYSPPLVVGPSKEIELEVESGFGGGRLEIDGQIAGERVQWVKIGLRPDVATMVSFPDQESLLSGLRRRGIIVDSPRIVADRGRDGDACPT